MPHPALLILGYSEAAMHLRKHSDVTAIISIHGSREFGVEMRVDHRLDLSFDDVEPVIPGDVVSLQRASTRQRWNELNGLREVAPTRDDASAILAFADRVRGVDGTLLCHCFAGMSRAPAAALACLAAWRGPGEEDVCAAEIMAARRGAVPHIGLVRFVDDALGRRGALVNAVVRARMP